MEGAEEKMIDVKVIASGSKGNCTLLTTDQGERILCDVGIPLKKILEATDYQNPDYAIVTHEHGDHANIQAIKTLIARGTVFRMTQGTREALELKGSHNVLTTIPSVIAQTSRLGSCRLLMLDAHHDAVDPIAIQICDDEDKILYVTDTARIYLRDQKPCYTKIIIETNHSIEGLVRSSIDEAQKERIKNNHLSIDKVCNYFRRLKKSDELSVLKEVHLIHISERHGNGERFKRMVEKIIGDIPIYVH